LFKPRKLSPQEDLTQYTRGVEGAGASTNMGVDPMIEAVASSGKLIQNPENIARFKPIFEHLREIRSSIAGSNKRESSRKSGCIPPALISNITLVLTYERDLSKPGLSFSKEILELSQVAPVQECPGPVLSMQRNTYYWTPRSPLQLSNFV